MKEAIEYLKLATDKTEAGDLIKENNLTETVVKLMDNYVEFRVKNCSIPDVISRFSDEKLSEIADKQVHISNGCFGELDFTQGKREGFEEGLCYFRDVLLNAL